MEKNAVERAVQAVGGPTQASHICDVSVWAIRIWRKTGIVPDTRAAILLSEATDGDISVRELAGLENGDGGPRHRSRRFQPGGKITVTYPASRPDPAIDPAARLSAAA